MTKCWEKIKSLDGGYIYRCPSCLKLSYYDLCYCPNCGDHVVTDSPKIKIQQEAKKPLGKPKTALQLQKYEALKERSELNARIEYAKAVEEQSKMKKGKKKNGKRNKNTEEL